MNDCLCNECANCHFYKGAVRGIMDADPDELDCDAGEYDFFFQDWEKDEFGDLIECPSYHYSWYDDYYPDDYADRRYDEMRDEGLI